MKARITILAIAMTLLAQGKAMAGNFVDNLQLKARVGYNIGGTAPLGLPATIRSLDSYKLTPSLMVGFDAMSPIGGQEGLMVGLHFENKGMDGGVTTKNYYMEMVKGSSHLAGMYTGGVRQKVKEWMLTLPVLAALQLGYSSTSSSLSLQAVNAVAPSNRANM